MNKEDLYKMAKIKLSSVYGKTCRTDPEKDLPASDEDMKILEAREDLHWMREVYGPAQSPKRCVLSYEIISIDANRKTNTIWMRFRPDQWPDIKAYFLKSIHPEHYYIREVETNKFVRFMDAVNRDRIRAETGQNRE